MRFFYDFYRYYLFISILDNNPYFYTKTLTNKPKIYKIRNKSEYNRIYI